MDIFLPAGRLTKMNQGLWNSMSNCNKSALYPNIIYKYVASVNSTMEKFGFQMTNIFWEKLSITKYPISCGRKNYQLTLTLRLLYKETKESCGSPEKRDWRKWTLRGSW